MKKVTEAVLYHINAKNGLNPYELLKIGSVFDTTEFNPFRKSYENGSMDYNIDPVSSAKTYWRFTKEYVFEQTRLSINENLPSRWNCIWLCNEEQLEYWRQFYEDVEYQILKVKVSGKIFKGDAYWVETYIPKPLVEIRERAIHYWNGDFFSLPGKGEILFEGTVKVKEILKQKQS
ncbi:DUF2441 domain-containing protein [Rossellomorea marisflavi]|uniref:DUF2441 domain-containing protein n=1 Tax=Rossellomorea marisflavi TaxID=189381 RepID=UPI003D2F04EF